ncbi:MAG: DUF1844 domain-containing protein [Acidobacteria bacterium]|nr:DUF1844 domain-containing protein [Acidobacteriota bacterium]
MTEPREKSPIRESIRVVDRRYFTPDGVPRTPDGVSEEIPLSPPGKGPQPLVGPQPPTGPQDRAVGPDVPADGKDRGSPGAGDERLASSHFKNLVLGLGSQAAAVLRELANSRGQATEIGLEGARQMIDILESLRLKTRGNLSSDESTLLDDLIYDLQMEFMSLQGQPPPKT